MNFDIAYQIILPILQKIVEMTHSYGWAIILLTIGFRALVWPLVAQTTTSMRRMSKLQPQMKILQERYKDNPEQLQKKLMEFYAKNKINPMGGCLPMLIQLPILFALYFTFNGPPFTDKTIDVKLNVVPLENAQSVKKDEASSANSIYISKDNVAAKVVVFPGNSTITAGSEVNFGTRAVEGKLPLDFAPRWRIIAPGSHEATDAKPPAEITQGKQTGESAWVGKVGNENQIERTKQQAKPPVNPGNNLGGTGKAPDNRLQACIDTTGHALFPGAGEYHVQAIIPGIAKTESFAFISGLGKIATGLNLLSPANFDVLLLILCFGTTMFLSQKLTVPAPQLKEGQELDEQQIIQQQTMKTMPIMTTAMFFFFPIPAGVYLYLVVSNIIQTVQTWMISRMPEAELTDVGEAEPPRGGGPGVNPAQSVGKVESPAGILSPNVMGNNGRSSSGGSGTAGGQEKKKSKRKKSR